MKKFFFLSLLAALFTFNACKDDDTSTSEPDYQISIESPDDTAKAVGDDLDIHIHFSDKNGGTVHHINVRIYEKDSGTEIYNKPDEEHVHAEGEYSFEDNITLTTAGHYVLEAKVWGHDDGVSEVVKSVEFHVN
ncbi:MAG: hypothetical protein GC192_08710 [Bacteroidetes bacterium]|nr:hypothetical protein [Bacteroidota bacterium]